MCVCVWYVACVCVWSGFSVFGESAHQQPRAGNTTHQRRAAFLSSGGREGAITVGSVRGGDFVCVDVFE